MKASTEWLCSSGAEFCPPGGRSGWAYLTHYAAEYWQWGEGPPIVLVPGLAGGCKLLGPLACQLASRHRVITFQLRGEDDCFSLRHSLSLQDLVDDVAEFVQGQGLETPTVLGVSFGGVLALELAARYPGRLGSLVVQGVGSHYVPGVLQNVAGTILARYPLPTDNPFVNQFFNLLFGSKQPPASLFQFVTRQCWQTDQSVMAHRFGLVQQFDIRPRLAEIRVPTLVLAGKRDVLVAEHGLRELCDGIANADVVRLKGCGHLAFVTDPERVAAEVTRFLTARVKLAV